MVDEGVWLSIEWNTLKHLRDTGQITREEYRRRDNSREERNRKYRSHRLSSEQWRALQQEVKNRLAVELPPLQQQWNAEAARLKAEADALKAKRGKEMEADVAVAAQLQTDRVFRLRHLQQKSIPAHEAETQNAVDAQKIAALQKKYSDYGDNWSGWFNDKLGYQTEKLVKARDLQERLADTTSEIGKDVQSAVQISQAIKRNEMRRAIGIIDLAELTRQNAPLEGALATLKAKYVAGGPLSTSSQDFYERLQVLDLRNQNAQRDLWEREARAEYAAKQKKALPQANQPARSAQERFEAHRQREAGAQKQRTEIRNNALTWQIKRAAIVLAFLALVVAGCMREMRRFGLDASDPFLMRAGWSSYKIHSITGTVLDPTKSRVVTTDVSGGGSYVSGGVTHTRPISTSTSTSIHEQFFLRASDGTEKAIQLTNFDLALREGHRMTAAWAIQKGKESGYYFLFRNHSTRGVDFSKLRLETMMRPSILLCLPLVSSVVAGICFVVFGGFRREGDTPATILAFGAMFGALLGALLIRVVCDLRVRRFKREIADRLIPIIDQRAARQDAPPSGSAVAPV